MRVDIDFKMTEGAIGEFKRALAGLGDEFAGGIVRIAVQGGGCSGFNYGLGFVSPDEVEVSDVVEEFDGLKLVVDKRSLFLLDGATLDWVDDPAGGGFKFENPNAKKSCGCKKSSSC